MNDPLKTELHHWGPQALSKHWEDENGNVFGSRPTGEQMIAPPKNFGALTNAHHVRLGGIWNYSIEPIFSTADGKFTKLVHDLNDLDYVPFDPKMELKKRFILQSHSVDFLNSYSDCFCSLILRSLKFRNSIKIFVNSLRPEKIAIGRNDNLYAVNIRQAYEGWNDILSSGLGIIALHSHDTEFIYGDGLLHNLSISPSHFVSPKFCIPITPNICITYFRNGRYKGRPKILSLLLSDEEVAFFNKTTQIYSKNEIFSRNTNVQIYDEFRQNKFLEYPYHNHPWLDFLLNEAADFIPKRQAQS